MFRVNILSKLLFCFPIFLMLCLTPSQSYFVLNTYIDFYCQEWTGMLYVSTNVTFELQGHLSTFQYFCQMSSVAGSGSISESILIQNLTITYPYFFNNPSSCTDIYSTRLSQFTTGTRYVRLISCDPMSNNYTQKLNIPVSGSWTVSQYNDSSCNNNDQLPLFSRIYVPYCYFYPYRLSFCENGQVFQQSFPDRFPLVCFQEPPTITIPLYPGMTIGSCNATYYGLVLEGCQNYIYPPNNFFTWVFICFVPPILFICFSMFFMGRHFYEGIYCVFTFQWSKAVVGFGLLKLFKFPWDEVYADLSSYPFISVVSFAFFFDWLMLFIIYIMLAAWNQDLPLCQEYGTWQFGNVFYVFFALITFFFCLFTAWSILWLWIGALMKSASDDDPNYIKQIRLRLNRKSRFHFNVKGKPVMDWGSILTAGILLVTTATFLGFGIGLINASLSIQYCSNQLALAIGIMCLIASLPIVFIAFYGFVSMTIWVTQGDPYGSPTIDSQASDSTNSSLISSEVSTRKNTLLNTNPEFWDQEQMAKWLSNMGFSKYGNSLKFIEPSMLNGINMSDLESNGMSDQHHLQSLILCASKLNIKKPFVDIGNDISTFDCQDMIDLLNACEIEQSAGIVEKYALNGIYFQSFNDSKELPVMLGLNVKQSKIDRQKLAFLYDIMGGNFQADFFTAKYSNSYWGWRSGYLIYTWLPHIGLSQYISKFQGSLFGALLPRFMEDSDDVLDDFYHELGVDMDFHAVSFDAAIEFIEDEYKSVDEVEGWAKSNGFDELVSSIRKNAVHGALLQYCINDQQLFNKIFPSLKSNSLQSQAFLDAIVSTFRLNEGRYRPILKTTVGSMVGNKNFHKMHRKDTL